MIPTHIKILYALHALVFCALIGMFLYVFPKPQQFSPAERTATGAPMDASTTAAIATVTVGNSANTPAAIKSGNIVKINGTVLTIKDQTGQTYDVSTTADTKVKLAGSQKDPAEYQKEMDAYYAHVKLLVQDPIKNKAALQALAMPNPVELKQVMLADLTMGDSIAAEAASPISGKSFVAATIIKSAATAQ